MSTPIQPLARSFTMVDGTGSPQTSPISSAANEAAIVVPSVSSTSAVFRLNVYLPSNPGTLRKVTGGATGGTCTIPQATWFAIPCKAGDTIYINRASATTIEFLFEHMI
jgi:hypothetical protein